MRQSMSGKLQQMVGCDTHTMIIFSANRVQGLYSQQDESQVEHNLHGKFITDADGRYSFYCLRPTPYPVPFDGPAGKILQLLDRHPYRPAHIHLIVNWVISNERDEC